LETAICKSTAVAAVQAYAADQKQIWRKTGTGDVGIDWQLEFVDSEGFATGRTIAVQVRARPSYFQHESAASWKFYPEAKHRIYWESFPLPMLLILYKTNTGVSYLTDARQNAKGALPGGSPLYRNCEGQWP
jgi:Domain of unknown function (DUF4365)